MLTTLQAKPEIWSLCITRFIDRQLMSQIIEQLAANLKAHAAKKKKGARKKAAK